MDLFAQLGLNSTLGIQLVLFLCVFAVLKTLLFVPYFAAYKERQARTLGKAELAERFIAEARELEERYGTRAQEMNDRFREIYDKSRAEATREYERVLQDSREKAKALTEQNQRRIHSEMEAARTQLSQEVRSVAQLINNKLIGKDLTQ